MKKGILFTLCAIFTSCLLTKQSQAQDFDLDFYQYFEANKADYAQTTARGAFTKWRGPLIPAPVVTINGISANVFQNNRVNNLSPGDETGTNGQVFVRASFGNADCIMELNSTASLRKVALQYAQGTMMINYFPTPRPDTTAVGGPAGLGRVLLNDWLATGMNKIGTNTSLSLPGVVEFFDVNDNPNGETVYVEIRRSGTSSTKLVRIAASTTNFTTLPLDLISFAAKVDAFGKGVNLKWQTTNEVNTKEFIIEKRTDDSEFSSIGVVSSKNTSGIHNYSFVDQNAISGNSYYRLKQVDNDGKFTYSPIQSVNIQGLVSLSLYPNPTTNDINLTHDASINGSVKILTIDGKNILNQDLVNGATNTNIGVSSLANGTYLVLLNNNGKQSSIKFIKE